MTDDSPTTDRTDRTDGARSAIRVLIVDDHPMVRTGLRGMLAGESDISVVAEADSGRGAIEAVDREPVDVVLMDLRMPGGDGVEATSAILAEHRSIAVVVVTTYDSDADIVRAVEAGAAGYLLKDSSRSELADAIRAAARGETVLAPSVAGRLLRHVREPAPKLLSGREIDVLALVADGRTNAEIGRQLHITEATVKTHLQRAFTKLDVSDRTAAVTTAMRLGLLSAGRGDPA